MSYQKSSKNCHTLANWSEQHRFTSSNQADFLEKLSTAKTYTFINQMHSYSK